MRETERSKIQVSTHLPHGGLCFGINGTFPFMHQLFDMWRSQDRDSII